MTYRNPPITVNQTYHVFNRSIAKQPIFLTNQDYQRALDTLVFYSYLDTKIRFSYFKRLSESLKNNFTDNLRRNGQKQVEILAFCFMPNHIHLLIKEVKEKGISTFMSNLQNSYAKYFNVRTDRDGSLFKTMFKATLIETDDQLIHVARYIHLNPVTAFILRDITQLENYPWSSFSIYIGKSNLDILNKDTILNFFTSIKEFIKFTEDQIDYQRELNQIKHLLLE